MTGVSPFEGYGYSAQDYQYIEDLDQQEVVERSSTYVSTGSKARAHSTPQASRSNSIALGVTSSLSGKNESGRSHAHSKSVLVVDNPSAPAMDIRVVTRAQTMDPSPSTNSHKNPLYMSDTNLQAMDIVHGPGFNTEYLANPSTNSLLHSSSSRYGHTPTSARSSESQHERPVSSLSTHQESASDKDTTNDLATIEEAGSIPDVFMQRSVV